MGLYCHETSAPTSLAGRIGPKEMGSRAIRTKRPRKKASDKQEPSEKQSAKHKAEAAGFGYADIIEVTQHVEGLTYRPRTAKTREVYQPILSSVHNALGDQAQDIVRSAADSVLETLKSDALTTKRKKFRKSLAQFPTSNFLSLLLYPKKSPTTMLRTRTW